MDCIICYSSEIQVKNWQYLLIEIKYWNQKSALKFEIWLKFV